VPVRKDFEKESLVPVELESLTGDAPREVAIGDLEKEISELWRSVAKDSENPEAVLRAAALTLVVYVDNAEAAEEVRSIAASLSEQNPCRVIILMAQPQAGPDGLRSWISAQCKCDAAVSNRKQIRGEQIVIRATGAAVPDLGSVVLPLTLSGLPVYFWWRAGRFAPPDYFDPILRIASHVLVDSARFENAESDMAALAEFVRKRTKQLAFVDLNWARLTPWRELISQCFDNPRVRGYVQQLRSLRIEYEAQSVRRAAQEAQALLIAGWLASRLKWQPAAHGATGREGARSFLAKSPWGSVEIQLARRAFEGGGEGVCFSVAMEASGEPPASFHLERGLDGRNVVTRAEVQGTPVVTRTVRLEVLEEAQLLNGELQLPGRDRVFEESLEMVARCRGS
jgi:glucose-6-phosphate dehydrogenase assembly protein OpcA